ncbi:MAG TPA: prepilin-type N-terminal cleavage/methylation domain-containing protein [Gemmatimonadaceae bacterium]|nr:prepilin-type N-terminal cleavage/methylation domain-containing protein [Gemmatimonadaceae bacterium]
MHRNVRKGFTLIELLIVVVIIGILAAIAIPKFANTKEKAYIAAMKSDLRNLVTAEEAFFADSVKYTATMAQLNFKPSTGVWTPTIAVGAGYWTAEVTHTQVTGKSCQIAVNTSNTLVSTAGDGEPACK